MYIFAYVLSFLLGIVNPYIGIFSFFNAIVLLIIFSFVLNGSRRIDIAHFAEHNGYTQESEIYRKSGKAQLTAATVVSIVCFIIAVFIFAVIWLISVHSYNGDTINTPIDVFGLQYKISVCAILLIASLVLHFLGVFLVIKKKKTILQGQTNRVYLEGVSYGTISFKLTTGTVILIISSMISSFMCAYISWVGVGLVLFYFIAWIIIKVNIKALLKSKDSTGLAGIHARYGLLQYQREGRLNSLYVTLGWVIATVAILIELVLLINKIEINPATLTDAAGTVLGIGTMILVVFTAYSFGRDVKQITVS